MSPRWSLAFLFAVQCASQAADRIRVATYNVENYVLASTSQRTAKPEASRAKVAAILGSLEADIVALQEVSGQAALQDMLNRLRASGLVYSHWEHVHGWDTNVQVALISRHPIRARRPHTKDTFLLSGRRFHVSRGILEVDVQVRPDYVLTVFTAHLKSRRVIPEASEAELRLAEARILREKIEERLAANPRANVVVLGDFNDTKDSLPVRTLLGRGRHRLMDTRPAEKNGDTGHTPDPAWQPRTVTWTHYYGKEDTYGRIDYVLLHPNTAREWVRGDSYLPAIPDWGLASDHRPLIVTLEARDR
jgi:endonuclease/exonuclease/phosphatase family metal-dependent hydrolase